MPNVGDGSKKRVRVWQQKYIYNVNASNKSNGICTRAVMKIQMYERLQFYRLQLIAETLLKRYFHSGKPPVVIVYGHLFLIVLSVLK